MVNNASTRITLAESIPVNHYYFAYGSNLNVPEITEHGVHPDGYKPLTPALLPDRELPSQSGPAAEAVEFWTSVRRLAPTS